MSWNNGLEKKKFEKKQAKQRIEYAKAGITEEQIQAMYEFDLRQFKAERTERTHTQRLDIEDEDDDENIEPNPLYDKFLELLSVRIEEINGDRYDWIENIEDEKMAKAVKSLSESDLGILTESLIGGLRQNEIAAKHGISNVMICNKIKRIKIFLRNYLSRVNF